MADLGDFIRLWTHPDYTPMQVKAEDLRRVEQRFDIALPADYREAVLIHGAPSPTLALLNSIVDNDIDLADIAEFFTPDEIISATEDWRAMRLPETLVAFEQGGTPGIWLFDHETGDVRQVGASFSDWLEPYCALPPAGID